jgi:beta-galactosidase/beta-glucuronidase
MSREHSAWAWVNLNGPWDYAILPRENPAPVRFDGQILVPYAVESLLSGVERALLPDQRLWYLRYFDAPSDWAENGKAACVLLHFGAVDYQCEVLINKKTAGTHTGGYLPFTLDITDLLVPGRNELQVSVWDPTDAGLQQRGKQTLNPRGIWYTSVSGIWQMVWLEVVPQVSIESLRLTPDLDTSCLAIEVVIRGEEPTGGISLLVEAYSEGKKVALAKGAIAVPLKLVISQPKLWSPTDPHLYDLRVQLLEDDRVLDEVGSYFAMRKFALQRDTGGKLRFTLNDEPLFLYGPLDQGYFPDGLYTPPSDDAMLFDIEYTRRIGCNLIRKHIKVEPLRWYYHCDRLGMIVWQDMPNGGLMDGDILAYFSSLLGIRRNDTRRLGLLGRKDELNRDEYLSDLKGMIDHLYNAPCIATWVSFNENWGQFHANQVADWVKTYDPTRLVDHASGWFDQGGGDFLSHHRYVLKLKPPNPDPRAYVLSETGGYSLKIPGHLWDEDRKFGYQSFNTTEELAKAYTLLLQEQIKPLIHHGLTAVVYTQTTDVEIEINGYLTYDRKVEKMDAEVLCRVHEDLINAGFSIAVGKEKIAG